MMIVSMCIGFWIDIDSIYVFFRTLETIEDWHVDG